jgi:hypothetical protein
MSVAVTLPALRREEWSHVSYTAYASFVLRSLTPLPPALTLFVCPYARRPARSTSRIGTQPSSPCLTTGEDGPPISGVCASSLFMACPERSCGRAQQAGAGLFPTCPDICREGCLACLTLESVLQQPGEAALVHQGSVCRQALHGGAPRVQHPGTQSGKAMAVPLNNLSPNS